MAAGSVGSLVFLVGDERRESGDSVRSLDRKAGDWLLDGVDGAGLGGMGESAATEEGARSIDFDL